MFHRPSNTKRTDRLCSDRMLCRFPARGGRAAGGSSARAPLDRVGRGAALPTDRAAASSSRCEGSAAQWQAESVGGCCSATSLSSRSYRIHTSHAGEARSRHTKAFVPALLAGTRSEEHTSELQSLMRISYAVLCLKKKTHK